MLANRSAKTLTRSGITNSTGTQHRNMHRVAGTVAGHIDHAARVALVSRMEPKRAQLTRIGLLKRCRQILLRMSRLTGRKPDATGRVTDAWSGPVLCPTYPALGHSHSSKHT